VGRNWAGPYAAFIVVISLLTASAVAISAPTISLLSLKL
jgi:hypothetical protein